MSAFVVNCYPTSGDYDANCNTDITVMSSEIPWSEIECIAQGG